MLQLRRVPLQEFKPVRLSLYIEIRDEHDRKSFEYKADGHSQVREEGKRKMGLPWVRRNALCSQSGMQLLRSRMGSKLEDTIPKQKDAMMFAVCGIKAVFWFSLWRLQK